MRRMRLTGCAAGALTLMAGWLGACEAAPETASRDASVADAPAPEPVDPAVGPSARAPQASEGSGSTETAEAAPVIATNDAGAAAPPKGWRRDGRPVWWLDEPQRDEGRLALSAEALGADVLAARRNAVAAARAALAARLGVAVVDAHILAAVVRPIGATEASPSAAKYVGYVLAAAAINNGGETPP